MRFLIEATLPDDQAQAFLDGLTGRDDDVLLAAETAIRERLGRAGEEIELSLEDEAQRLIAETAEVQVTGWRIYDADTEESVEQPVHGDAARHEFERTRRLNPAGHFELHRRVGGEWEVVR